MKKKTKIIIIAIIAVVAILAFYATYNLKKDKQDLIQILSYSSNGKMYKTLEAMDSINNFSNPIINIWYLKLKKQFRTRFAFQDEIIPDASSSKIINDISTIYRNYWRTELLKPDPADKSFDILYKNIGDYLFENQLTDLSYDSLSKTVAEDIELEKVIKNEGMYSKFLLNNGFQDVLIWAKQSEEEYTIELPDTTINIGVIFIEDYILRGYIEYATFGDSQIGGWASADESKLYCNKGSYNLESEHYKISYLKHEANHFVDLQKYPNLSSADLEYRSKLVELCYSDKKIYDLIQNFIRGASINNRSYSHPYSNYIIIQNLSNKLFSTDFETDINKWESLSSETVNNAAKELLLKNSSVLNKNSTEVI